jgi:3-hydroxybutyryl-CoA dehydrogenase
MSYFCEPCNKHWNYPVKKCIFCQGDIAEHRENMFTVIGFTQINIPSSGNDKVPYYDCLIQDNHGCKMIKKLYEKPEIGDIINIGEAKSKNTIVAIVGTGSMGTGIAEYVLRNDYPTIIKTRSKESIDKTISRVSGKLSKNLTDEEVAKYIKRLTVTTAYEDLKDCDIIIEAATEDLKIKADIFKALSGVCKPGTIFASNTSSLSIDEIANVTDRPEKTIGMHFFNPVSKMDLIEVIYGERTSRETIDKVIELSKELNKKPVVMKNSPGFIVNRLLLPQLNSAVRMMEEGIATKEDIDASMKLGLNHPMGPFALADLIGIDVCVLILERLYKGLENEYYKPAKTLYDLLNSGKLGVKSGQGFYTYKR